MSSRHIQLSTGRLIDYKAMNRLIREFAFDNARDV